MAADLMSGLANAQTRPLRLCGTIHHIVVRAEDGQLIFHTTSDRENFDVRVGELLRRHAARAHAYCCMTNHLHLAVEIDPDHALDFQRDIAAACGLPAPRVRPLLVDAQTYLLRLVRYIHLNPVLAGLVSNALDYPWSGHRVYLGYRGVPWLCTDHTLRLLGGDLLWATAAYQAYVQPEWPG